MSCSETKDCNADGRLLKKCPECLKTTEWLGPMRTLKDPNFVYGSFVCSYCPYGRPVERSFYGDYWLDQEQYMHAFDV